MAIGDFKAPGVTIQEVRGQPKFTSPSSSVAAFVGFTKKGPIDRAVLVTSFSDFEKKFGSYYHGHYMPYSMKGFFDEGGGAAFITRVVGENAEVASAQVPALVGGAAQAASLISANQEPFNLIPSGLTLVVSVDGGAPDTVSFLGTRATVTGSGGTYDGSFSGGEELVIVIDGGVEQTFVFDASDNSSVENIAAVINETIIGASAEVSSGELRIRSDVSGTNSSVQIVSGDAVALLGLVVGTTSGTGNVPDLSQVTAAQAASIVESGVADCTAFSEGGYLRIVSDTTGLSSSLEITGASTAATVFDFDTDTTVYGTASSLVYGLQIDAFDPGAWGNSISISTVKWERTLAAGLANTDTVAELTSVRDILVGDIVVFGDPLGNHAVAVVNEVDAVAKEIHFQALSGLSAGLLAGAPVRSSSMHRRVTTTSSAVLTTDTVIHLSNAKGISRGSVVTIDDGSEFSSFVVEEVSGNDIILGGAAGVAFASGAIVASQEFYLQITSEGQAGAPYEYLSMEPTNEADYIGVKLGEDNYTYLVKAVDLDEAAPHPAYRLPVPIRMSLEDGADGDALEEADILGQESPKRGLWVAKENANSFNFIAVPGSTSTVVQAALSDLANEIGTIEVIAAAPLGMNDADQLVNYKNNTLMIDNSHFTLYHPWLEERDPFVRLKKVVVPPEGRVAGAWAAVATSRGIHVAPANVALSNVLSLTHNVTETEHAILHPANINVIRLRPGRGIRIWGARTLTSETDGREAIPIRRVMSFIERFAGVTLESFLFEPLTTELYGRVRTTLDNFMNGLWRDGMFGSGFQEESYFVKCDLENNPPDVRDKNTLVADIGFVGVNPAEFIVVRVGTWNGGLSITEEIQRRG